MSTFQIRLDSRQRLRDFTWILESRLRGQRQTAYRILVASSNDKLAMETGDKWDSGKITSDRSVNVAYEGQPRSSGETLYWTVRVWDADGRPSAWSQLANFEIGLLRHSDWQGQWIGRGAESTPATDRPAPLLRKSFELAKRVSRTRIYVSGVGWYELYINGKRVGNHVLDPAMTNYAKRVLLASYDVTSLLSTGRNAVAATLGNGWYSQPGRFRYGTRPVCWLR